MTNDVSLGYTAKLTVQEDEININGPLLRETAKKQGRAWLVPGLVIFSLLLLCELLLVKQSYTATVSLIIQQSAGSGSPLVIFGGGGTNNRYLGILKSRLAASRVERILHLQERLHLPSSQAATGMLMGGVKAEDNPTDGLLYIHVTLPGPARLSLHPHVPNSQIKIAAADAANTYAAVLHEYYINNDNEEGSVLLRGADEQERIAQANYDSALAQELTFARGLRRLDPRAAPSASVEAAAAAGTEISGLYATLAQVEAQISQSEAVQTSQKTQTNRQLDRIGELSSEDPLLAEARTRVSQDQRDLSALNLIDGPDNPDIIRATERLQTDQAALARQAQGVSGSLNTETVQQVALLQGLRAREDTLRRQILGAERRLGVSRELSGQFERLEDNLALQRQILGTTVTEATKVRLDNASSKSRTELIDPATPPLQGDQGMARFAVINILVLLFAFAALVVRAYLAELRRLNASAFRMNLQEVASGGHPVL